ncbi:MAG: hypothetical protein CMH26_08295 [Micavibrio sp.]|nr:hypothetical protein [Micavibrio sp.]|tara:strand:+ start:804 stop:1304 length:501 start_codon:yes stop_codon:yes gene_type:complete
MTNGFASKGEAAEKFATAKGISYSEAMEQIDEHIKNATKTILTALEVQCPVLENEFFDVRQLGKVMGYDVNYCIEACNCSGIFVNIIIENDLRQIELYLSNNSGNYSAALYEVFDDDRPVSLLDDCDDEDVNVEKLSQVIETFAYEIEDMCAQGLKANNFDHLPRC